MKAAKRYAAHIGRTLERLATWMPGDRLALGDVGELEGGRFRKLGSLREHNVGFDVEMGAEQPALSASTTSELVLDSGVDQLRGKGQMLTVGFGREGSTVFEAERVRHSRIRNQGAVELELARRLAAGEWRRSWIVVDQVWTAASATIVIATSADARVVARGPKLAGLGALASLAHGELECVSGSTVKLEGLRSCTPLFTARGFGFFGQAKSVRRGSGDVTEAMGSVSVATLVESLGMTPLDAP